MTEGRSVEGADRVGGVHEPRQRRSAETFERLVSAAERLLVEGGPEALTVQELVRRADSSVGSFYARFDGRDTVLRYVQDRFWRRAAERWDAYFADERARGGSPGAALARFTRLLVRSTSADRERLRAFLRLALAEPELGLLDRTRALDARIVEGAERLFRELLDAGEPGGGEPGGGEPGGGEKTPAAAPSRAPALRRPLPRDAARREAIRGILAVVRDAVLFRRPTPAEERQLILALVRRAAAGIGVDDPPASYAELLRRCRPSETRSDRAP